jgi:ABC-type antimicrobial peptide transport system permease subunit
MVNGLVQKMVSLMILIFWLLLQMLSFCGLVREVSVLEGRYVLFDEAHIWVGFIMARVYVCSPLPISVPISKPAP